MIREFARGSCLEEKRKVSISDPDQGIDAVPERRKDAA